jgi:hypothetical protein
MKREGSAIYMTSPITKRYIASPNLLKRYAQFCAWRDAKVAICVDEAQGDMFEGD